MQYFTMQFIAWVAGLRMAFRLRRIGPVGAAAPKKTCWPRLWNFDVTMELFLSSDLGGFAFVANTIGNHEIMSWHAIAIGVAKAGLLKQLPGAVNGAKDFAAWARAQNYKTTLITDEGAPVRLATIAGAIADILDSDFPSRLIVFFAGHGAQQNVTTPVWLLSNWQTQNGEAIDVERTRFMASRSGIPRVAIFADACRNIVGEAATLSPLPILPRLAPSKNPRAMTQCDLFFSCRFDEISQEVGGKSDPSRAFGIFTRCLLSALNGEQKEAIESYPPPPDKVAVTSRKLATFLDNSVPRESGRIPGAEVQFPEIWPVWRQPDEAYSLAPFPRCIALPDPQEDLSFGKVRGSDKGTTSLKQGELEAAFAKTAALAAKDKIMQAERKSKVQLQSLVREFDLAFSGHDVGIRTGIKIIGDTPVQVVVAGLGFIDREKIIQEGAAFQIDLEDDGSPHSVAVRLANGNWAAAVCLPGYVSLVLIKDGVSAGLTFTSKIDSWRADVAAEQRATVNRWAAAMHQGRLASRLELQANTSNLQQDRYCNPALSLLAAYGYERLGDMNGIDKLAQYFTQKRESVLFDVGMLCDAPMTRSTGKDFQVELSHGGEPQIATIAGSFPLLSRGWSLIDQSALVSTALEALRPQLVRALFTTLSPEGGEALAEQLTKGEI